MKILTVYYSRTGKVKAVAETIAKNLSSELEEIHDQKNRSGIWKAIVTGIEAGMKKSTTITNGQSNPADYDLVIIGTPVWASSMACAVREWLLQHAKDLKQVAFFATTGGGGSEKTFKEMAALANQTPITTMALTDKSIAANTYQQQLERFITLIKKLDQ